MSGATVAEEPQPEPTFKLVNETVTFECGSNPSTDIHDYLIADEYSNIQISDEGKGRHVYDTDTFSKFMEDANEMISNKKIYFKDISTGYETMMTVISEDTIAPVASVNHNDYTFYLKTLIREPWPEDEDPLLVLENPELMPDPNSYIIEKKADWEIREKGGVYFDALYTELGDNPFPNCFYVSYTDATLCTIRWEKGGNSTYPTNCDFDLLTPDLTPGTYENNIIITDGGGNSTSIPITFYIVDDVDPKKREEILAMGGKIRED